MLPEDRLDPGGRGELGRQPVENPLGNEAFLGHVAGRGDENPQQCCAPGALRGRGRSDWSSRHLPMRVASALPMPCQKLPRRSRLCPLSEQADKANLHGGVQSRGKSLSHTSR